MSSNPGPPSPGLCAPRLPLVDALKSRGLLIYILVCLSAMLAVIMPLGGDLRLPARSHDEAMVFWLAFGFLFPVLETWLLQDCLQEALLLRDVGRWQRVCISWAAFALLHASSVSRLLLVGGVQGLLYAATYAAWRPDGRNRAFAAVLYLHLIANNIMLWAPMVEAEHA